MAIKLVEILTLVQRLDLWLHKRKKIIIKWVHKRQWNKQYLIFLDHFGQIIKKAVLSKKVSLLFLGSWHLPSALRSVTFVPRASEMCNVGCRDFQLYSESSLTLLCRLTWEFHWASPRWAPSVTTRTCFLFFAFSDEVIKPGRKPHAEMTRENVVIFHRDSK